MECVPDLLTIYSLILVSNVLGQIYPKLQLAYIGSSANITCESSVLVEFFKSNGGIKLNPIVNGDTYTLVFNNVYQFHEDIYECSGITSYGAPFNLYSELVVGYKNNLSSPSTQTVKIGKRAVLFCNTSDEYATWYFTKQEGSMIIHPQDVRTVYKGVLLINNVNLNHAGYYYCKCYREERLMRAPYISLSVLKVEPTYKQHLIRPQILTVMLGSSEAYFRCHTKKVKAEWTFNEAELPKNVRIHGLEFLFIENVTLKNKGYYLCQGKNKTGHTFYAKGLLKVIVSKQERIDPPIQSVPANTDANFTCISNGEVEWKFNKGPLPNNGRTIIETDTLFGNRKRNVLTLYGVTTLNSGKYECTGDDEEEFVIFSAVGELRVVSKVVNALSKVTKALIDEIVDLQCSYGSNNWRWTWNYLGSPLPPNFVPQTVFGAQTKAYIKKAKVENAGIYTCTAYDGDKEVYSKSTSLEVAVAAQCSSPELDLHGKVRQTGSGEGDMAQYICNPGYVLKGYHQRICMSDGEWSGSAPVCIGTQADASSSASIQEHLILCHIFMFVSILTCKM